MTKLNKEMRELTINELDEVRGGSWLLDIAGWHTLATIAETGVITADGHRQALQFPF